MKVCSDARDEHYKSGAERLAVCVDGVPVNDWIYYDVEEGYVEYHVRAPNGNWRRSSNGPLGIHSEVIKGVVTVQK